VERVKVLLQIVNRPWFWFAVALACGVAAVLFSWTVRVPHHVSRSGPHTWNIAQHIEHWDHVSWQSSSPSAFCSHHSVHWGTLPCLSRKKMSNLFNTRSPRLAGPQNRCYNEPRLHERDGRRKQGKREARLSAHASPGSSSPHKGVKEKKYPCQRSPLTPPLSNK
jgi:hypothetical protein